MRGWHVWPACVAGSASVGAGIGRAVVVGVGLGKAQAAVDGQRRRIVGLHLQIGGAGTPLHRLGQQLAAQQTRQALAIIEGCADDGAGGFREKSWIKRLLKELANSLKTVS